MTISFKAMFDVQTYARLKQNLQTLERKLAEHLHMVKESEKVEADFKEGIAHVTSELEKVKAEIHPLVVEHLEEGMHPEVALENGLKRAAAEAAAVVEKPTEEPPTA